MTEAITTATIADICKTYGFDYELRPNGKHFAMVGEEMFELVFDERTGRLRKDLNAFLRAARAASDAFATDFPSTHKRKTVAGSGHGLPPDDGELPTLDKAFLKQYSAAALERERPALDEVLAEKLASREANREQARSVKTSITHMKRSIAYWRRAGRDVSAMQAELEGEISGLAELLG